MNDFEDWANAVDEELHASPLSGEYTIEMRSDRAIWSREGSEAVAIPAGDGVHVGVRSNDGRTTWFLLEADATEPAHAITLMLLAI